MAKLCDFKCDNPVLSWLKYLLIVKTHEHVTNCKTKFFGATEIAGQENAGLEIDGQKLQEVENDGHSIKG